MILPLALAALLTAQPAGPDVRREESNDLLELRYGWPATVEAEPALRARLEADMRQNLESARSVAGMGRALDRRTGAAQSARPVIEIVWEVAGRTPRLISLFARNRGSDAGVTTVQYLPMLWDRTAGIDLSMRSLLGDSAAARLQARYCTAYNAAGNGQDCPALEERVLVPADGDGNGRLDTLRVITELQQAEPAPGDIVELRFEPGDLEGMDAALSGDFETSR
jgi:hypothetical protein